MALESTSYNKLCGETVKNIFFLSAKMDVSPKMDGSPLWMAECTP